jgi:ferritin
MLTHLANHHPKFRESLILSDADASTFFRVISDDDSQNTYKWIDWIVNSDSDKSFSFCECPKTRKYTKLEDISRKRVGVLIDKLANKVVRRKISAYISSQDIDPLITKVHDLCVDLRKLKNCLKLYTGKIV